jgi:MFS family permease
MTPARTAAIALAITLAIQVFTSLAATATSVLAPIIAGELALPGKLVGVFVGIIYVGSMFASLGSGAFIERFGAIRVSQVCVLLCAAGLALVATAAARPSSSIALLAFAPFIIGLGYGPITPASSHLLIRTARPTRMALTFSIKQTGVPAGTALAGALLPGLAVTLEWRTTFLVVTILGLAVAAAAQSTRATFDADRTRSRPLSLGAVVAPLRVVFATPTLMLLALTGFAYAAAQVSLVSFLVIYLTETLGRSLVAAGLALTVANVGGIVGRIGWGAVADHYLRPRTLLGLIGIAAGGCSYATAAFDATWSVVPTLAVCALFGATAIGWNGVQLAELAKSAPPGQAATVTGAANFVTFAGVVVGPPTFALLAAIAESYRVGFAVFESLSAVCGLWVLIASK